jgi:hypothetical protein
MQEQLNNKCDLLVCTLLVALLDDLGYCEDSNDLRLCYGMENTFVDCRLVSRLRSYHPVCT